MKLRRRCSIDFNDLGFNFYVHMVNNMVNNVSMIMAMIQFEFVMILMCIQ